MPRGVHDNHRKGDHAGGLSHRDIADRLGVSHGTVINIEKRALEKMRKAAEANGMGKEAFRELLTWLHKSQSDQET